MGDRMKIKSGMLIAVLASVSITGKSFGEAVSAAVTEDAPTLKKTKGKTGKNDVEESDEALSRRVDALQKELGSLKSELAKNAEARTEQTQQRIKQEVDGLEKRLAELQSQIKKLGESSTEDLKSSLKRNVGAALTSAGDLLKKLGKEVSQ